jgi:hypothetical protein
MGLFDKRKKGEDDYDSPVEQVNLNATRPAAQGRTSGSVPAQPAPAPAPAAAAPQPAPAAPASAPVPAAAAPAPAPAPARAPEPDLDAPAFGIDKAIELMRALPIDNVELVVQVVKKTLESLGVQVPVIIKDGSRKLKDIEGRVDVLKKEIADLEAEIATRKNEIAALEADHRETTTVRDRLELAEKITGKTVAASAPGAPSSPGSPALPGLPPPSGAPAGATTRSPARASDAYAAIQTKPGDPPRSSTIPPPSGSPGGTDPQKK